MLFSLFPHRPFRLTNTSYLKGGSEKIHQNLKGNWHQFWQHWFYYVFGGGVGVTKLGITKLGIHKSNHRRENYSKNCRLHDLQTNLEIYFPFQQYQVFLMMSWQQLYTFLSNIWHYFSLSGIEHIKNIHQSYSAIR